MRQWYCWCVCFLRLFSFRRSVLNIHRWNNFTSGTCFIIIWLTVVLCVYAHVLGWRVVKKLWMNGIDGELTIFRARWRYMGLIVYIVLCVVSALYLQVLHLWIQSTTDWKSFFKFPESSRRQNVNFPCVGTYLYSIYTAFSIKTNLEMI